MKISVVVLTYNSKLECVLNTLKSVVLQRMDSFEIIVSDDGSAFFPHKEIDEFLSDNFHGCYRILANEVNVGTVQHCFNVAKESSGKYIKLLGAGDLLYDDDTLSSFYTFMEQYNLKLGLGKLIGFNCVDGVINTFPFAAPLIQKPYILGDSRKIKNNLIFKQDFICGACMFFERKYLIHVLSIIKEYVRYVEDLCEFIAVFEGVEIRMLDKYIVCYEHGVGVSFSNTSKLQPDYCMFWEKIQTHTNSQREKNRFEAYYQIYRLGSKQKLRILVLRLFHTPEYFYMMLLRKLFNLKNKIYKLQVPETCLVSVVKNHE